VAAAGLHQVGGNGAEGSAFGGLFLVFVFYAFHCADGGACHCRCSSVLLRAGAALNRTFLNGFYAVIAGDAYDFRDNGQVTKWGVQFVEGQPDLSAAGNSRGLDAAHVSLNFGSRRQVKSAACLQWFERPYPERRVFLRTLGAQVVFKTHEEFGAGSHGKSLYREPMALAIGAMTRLIVTLRGAPVAWSFNRLLGAQRYGSTETDNEHSGADENRAEFQTIHVSSRTAPGTALCIFKARRESIRTARTG